MRLRSPVPALACALALAAGWPEAAETATLRVGSEAAFAAAVQKLGQRGGTIVLRAGRYDLLFVSRRGTRPLTIRGERGASVRWLRLEGARAVRLVGLRIESRWSEARLEIAHSRNVVVERVLVRGKTHVPAWIKLDGSHRVTVRRSEFTRCGELTACILTGRTSRLRLVRNRFHDCRGCDFVRGRFGPGMLIRENRFDRALRGPCGWNPAVCNHQDLIELQGGRGLVVERNHFGLYQLPGGGQLYLLQEVRDVVVRNNVFLARDPRVPGVESHVGINLGGKRDVPRNVLITHNTVLSGKRRPAKGVNGSVRFVERYARIPHGQRPILANNVIRLARNPRQLCDWAKWSAANVILDGAGCSASDVVGDPRLDRRGRPTSGSTLTIDGADGRWPTLYDFDRTRRDAQPDIGAYEFVPTRR
jgi:hypothetical protein